MIYLRNCTPITEIHLSGFYSFHGFRFPTFVFFLVIFLLTFWENVLIIYIISVSSRLHAPMFFIIQSICVSDLLGVLNIIPKFLNDVLSERPTVTITGCIVQLQIYGTQGDIGTAHYALMSYDRYLAICHPLRYSSFVNNRIYLQSVVVIWIISATLTAVITGLQSQLEFCGRNELPHFFCDSSPLMDLAISDTAHIHLIITIVSTLMILITILSVFITYSFIIHTILKIPSASGRRKTFSTCSSHLIVFSMQSGLALGVYGLPAQVVTSHVTNTFTFIQFFWTPLVNPLIYSFNNKEFRAEIVKKFKKIESSF